MLEKRKSLGRGLNALLGDDDLSFEKIEQSAGNKPSGLVAVDLIALSPFQPRTEFDQDALKALAASIKEKGVLQPLLVRRMGQGYELIAGERRLRAAKLAGLKAVPVIEKDLTDKEVWEVALVENLLRENLSAIEEAEGFQRLIDEFHYTQEALSGVIGKSRPHIANLLRLLTLPNDVQRLVRDGKLSAGHARCLVGLDNAYALAKQIIEKDLSVRAIEELVAKQKHATAKPTAKKTKKDEDIEQIEKDLIKSLGLRIKISPSKQGGGKVVLQYASVAELDMIIDVLESKKPNKPADNNTVFKPAPNNKFTMKVVG